MGKQMPRVRQRKRKGNKKKKEEEEKGKTTSSSTNLRDQAKAAPEAAGNAATRSGDYWKMNSVDDVVARTGGSRLENAIQEKGEEGEDEKADAEHWQRDTSTATRTTKTTV